MSRESPPAILHFIKITVTAEVIKNDHRHRADWFIISTRYHFDAFQNFPPKIDKAWLFETI